MLIGAQMRLSASEFSFTNAPLATISLHALARRYQRGFNNSDAAISTDLHALSRPPPGLLDNFGDFYIATESGFWVGPVVEIEDRGGPARILVARTFVTEDMTVSLRVTEDALDDAA